MLGRRKFSIITGAGLSAESGIPSLSETKSGWMKLYAGHADPTDILTHDFFSDNPHATWEWFFDFSQNCKSSQPNTGHKAIKEFQEYCLQNALLDVMLITQNIDDLHNCEIQESTLLQNATDKYFTS